MQLAHIPTRLLSIDPKRIVATSAAFVVHVAVLMILMMPAQVSPPTLIKDTPMVAVPFERVIPPPPPPPPPPAEPTKTRRTTTETLLPPPPLQVAVENSEPRASDIFVESTTTEVVEATSYSEPTIPSFAPIRADLAPAPPYPPQAQRRGLTGLVMLRILVDETGKPIEVVVETSSGQRVLDDAAKKFVLNRWHFVPATKGSRAIQAYALVPISFELKR